jgi:hypothetical protein
MGLHSGNTSDSYLGGARFEPRLDHLLFWPRFSFFFTVPSGHDLFLPDRFQCMSSYHLMLYSVATDSVIRYLPQIKGVDRQIRV